MSEQEKTPEEKAMENMTPEEIVKRQEELLKTKRVQNHFQLLKDQAKILNKRPEVDTKEEMDKIIDPLLGKDDIE